MQFLQQANIMLIMPLRNVLLIVIKLLQINLLLILLLCKSSILYCDALVGPSSGGLFYYASSLCFRERRIMFSTDSIACV